MASTRSMARAAARAATMFTLALAITGCGMPSSDETPGYRHVTVTASGPVAVTVGDTVAVMLEQRAIDGVEAPLPLEWCKPKWGKNL